MTERAGGGRVVIEGVDPEVDCGRFPAKRIAGDVVVVEADIFADGHDALACVLRHRRAGAREWTETPMTLLGNDRWRGEFPVSELGRYVYTLEGWVDEFETWRQALEKKVAAGQDVSVDLLAGAEHVARAAARASGEDAKRLDAWSKALRTERGSETGVAARIELALSPELAATAARHPDRERATRYGKELEVVVDREKARFSTWYEMFPRSFGREPGRHASFRDAETALAYVASMGFDVLYLPPIHPIGRTERKGKNGTLAATPGEPGSPWAIGAEEGGHTAVHPELGTLEDFHRFVAKAKEHGLEVALDLAYQCSPDHPWVREHPEWFRTRPDGRIQYAENPPKKYQDIYPIDFETRTRRELWDALKGVVDFWIGQGVRIFRVDNPHTKPFEFWEWMLGELKAEHPDVIFLSEAFTRPRIMYRLAKLGFTQSYTYFAWRNTKWELTQYFTDLTRSAVKEYFRPHLWPNTPDILTEYLQVGGRPAFLARLVLAATLGASYGIYGPAFELCVHRVREPGSEEYLDSEKYEIKTWDLARKDSLREIIARVNKIRRENPALQRDDGLGFHPVDNDELIAYHKRTPDGSNVVLVVVNLDPRHTQGGWLSLDLGAMGLDPEQPYQVHDQLGDGRFLWHGGRNYVELNPHVVPAHIFRVRRRVRTERDFEYFL